MTTPAADTASGNPDAVDILSALIENRSITLPNGTVLACNAASDLSMDRPIIQVAAAINHDLSICAMLPTAGGDPAPSAETEPEIGQAPTL